VQCKQKVEVGFGFSSTLLEDVGGNRPKLITIAGENTLTINLHYKIMMLRVN
jgi:hypothetical protein